VLPLVSATSDSVETFHRLAGRGLVLRTAKTRPLHKSQAINCSDVFVTIIARKMMAYLMSVLLSN
jgi:hypothetical protein